MTPVTGPGSLPERTPSTYTIQPQSTADDWSEPVSTWGATKLSLTIAANAVEVQLSRDQPPHPPTWDAPIRLNPGPWSHAGPFGYVRFRNATPGAAAAIFGTAYSE